MKCFHSYSTKKELKIHEKVCNDHDHCYVEMSDEDNKILQYNHGEKSLKAPFMICADSECLLEKMHLYQNNLEKPYTEKKKLGLRLLINHCLQVVRLTQQKNKVDCYKDNSKEQYGKVL